MILSSQQTWQDILEIWTNLNHELKATPLMLKEKTESYQASFYFIWLTLVTQQNLGRFVNKWTDLLFVEFFNQGDNERKLGINISMLMDRTTVNIAKAQDGFIKFLIKPAFVSLSTMLPYLELNINYMDENLDKWASKVIEYSDANALLDENIENNKPLPIIKVDEKSSSSENSFSNEDPEELDEEIKDIKTNKIKSIHSNSGLARVIYYFH